MAVNLLGTATTGVRAALTVIGLMFIPGCIIDSTDDRIYDGSLIVDWTIDDFKDPDECRQSDVSEIEIVVTTPRGTILDEFLAPCEDFETVIDLSPGDYAGDSTLLDPDGFARTTAVRLGVFAIFENSDTVIPINFPPSSFQ